MSAKPLIRSWKTSRSQFAGDEDAVRLGHALAQVADAEFIQSVIDAKALLDRVGGQLFVGAARAKFDQRGQIIERGAGEFETIAYLFNYSSRLDPAIDRQALEPAPEPEPEPAAVSSNGVPDDAPAPPDSDTEGAEVADGG